MILKAIVAKSIDNVIGIDGQLPWKLSEDMDFFKTSTFGATVIMGSKTWYSLYLRPLPERTNVVVSRFSATSATEGAVVLHCVEDVLFFLQHSAPEEAWVIGGAAIYKLFAPFIEEWYITEVNEILGKGTKIEPLNKEIWKCEEVTPARSFNGAFKRYVRR